MKKIKIKKKNFLKKVFIKICRILGYEIIDQNNFEIPTLNKKASENISVLGKKSISIPLGEIKIERKVKSLNIYFRSCSKVKLWKQNKERVFEAEKDEYSLRSLKSILRSIDYFKRNSNEIDIKLLIIDDNSGDAFIQKMNDIIIKYNTNFQIIKLKVDNTSTEKLDSNFVSLKKCFSHAKENANDIIYFVEDDYIHDKICFLEMIGAYERISTQLNKEILLCPSDYPYLYADCNSTYIVLGNKRHWRTTEQSLGTFLISKINLDKYWDHLMQFASGKDDPVELGLHKIYEIENCFSPIPTLAIHCANINSIYGISPNVNWKKFWEESE